MLQAVAGHYLQALGFDPDRAAEQHADHAAAVNQFLRTARKQRLRRTLLHLADCLDATIQDSDITAAASVPAHLPDDVREVGTGVNAAIQLYGHAVRTLTVDVQYYLCDGLGGADQPNVLRPFTDADTFTIHPN